MFSRRLPWHLPPNALAVLADRKRAAGARLLDLTTSNPTTAGIAYPEAIVGALADPRALLYHPDPRGDEAARHAVAGYYAGRGETVDPDRIVLTASTSEAYGWLFKLLCDPGDAVLVPRPSYPLFDFLAGLEAARPLSYALGFDGGFYFDVGEIERGLDAAEAAGERVRAILCVHPNNPTGTFLHLAERDALVRLGAERGLPLIVDEVFSDYGLTADPTRVATLVGERRGLVFCLSGLSKVLGLPQLKLGWIHVGGSEALAGEAMARLELVADTYLSVSAPVALAAPALLALRPALGEAIAARLRESLSVVRRALAGAAVSVLPVEGGWYATLRLPCTRSDEEWALALLGEDDVLGQPGYFYDLPVEACLVVSLLTPPALLGEGLRRLRARVEAGSGAARS